MPKKRWSELSPRARAAIVVGASVELVVTAIALQDLIRRPSSQIRGPKALWALGLFVQPIGSPLYLFVGRRAGTSGPGGVIRERGRALR